MLFFQPINLYSQSSNSVDRATREVNEPFRKEAEEKLVSPYRKAPVITYGRLDLTDVPDGVYKGKAIDFGDSVIRVDVNVKNSQIADIKIIDAKNTNYVKKTESIIDSVITEQSLEVDAVTGATVTSEAILAAVKNALGREDEI